MQLHQLFFAIWHDLQLGVGTDRNGLLAAGPDFAGISINCPVSRILPDRNRCSEVEIYGSRNLLEILNLSLFLDFCHYQL